MSVGIFFGVRGGGIGVGFGLCWWFGLCFGLGLMCASMLLGVTLHVAKRDVREC